MFVRLLGSQYSSSLWWTSPYQGRALRYPKAGRGGPLRAPETDPPFAGCQGNLLCRDGGVFASIAGMVASMPCMSMSMSKHRRQPAQKHTDSEARHGMAIGTKAPALLRLLEAATGLATRPHCKAFLVAHSSPFGLNARRHIELRGFPSGQCLVSQGLA